MFITKLWRGEYSLAVSYWIFGALGNLLMAIPLALIDISSSTEKQWLLSGITLAITILVNIGIWRSANNYLGFKLWKILAKIAVIISIALTIISLSVFALNPDFPSLDKASILGS